MNLKNLFAVSVLLSLAASGCLRSRSELKGEEQQSEAPAPVKVKPIPVQPQPVSSSGGQYAVEELKNEITNLNGRIEDLERSQQQVGRLSREDFSKLENRIGELEKAQAVMLDAMRGMQDRLPPADPSNLLREGKQFLQRRDYSSAVDSLTRYLENPRAMNIEEALFFRGDAFFMSKNYKKAIVDFSKFQENYTNSKYAPTALFKIGQSFEALGSRDDAKTFYQLLLEKYPKSAEAKQLKKK